jgi:hypothetical protein
MHENVDVAVIGAGMGGLGAAIKLRESGARFAALEAGDRAGGRVETIHHEELGDIDTGAHWDHKRGDSSLHPEIKASGLQHRIVDMASYSIYRDKLYDDQELKRLFLDAFAEGYQRNQALNDGMWDGTMEDCIADPHLRGTAKYWRKVWFAGFQAGSVSARDFNEDPYGFGGTVIKGGLGRLVDHLTQKAGPENMRFNAPVSAITRNGAFHIHLANGDTVKAGKVIITTSVDVIKKKRIIIDPNFSPQTKKQLETLIMGQMAKVILPLRRVAGAPTFRIDMMDAPIQHSLHVGTHTLSALFGGEDALKMERKMRDCAGGVIRADFPQLRRLMGDLWDTVESRFDPKAAPFVSRWSKKWNFGGAYSCIRPKAKRSGPVNDGGVVLAGEAFHKHPGHFSSAYDSGRAAATLACG